MPKSDHITRGTTPDPMAIPATGPERALYLALCREFPTLDPKAESLPWKFPLQFQQRILRKGKLNCGYPKHQNLRRQVLELTDSRVDTNKLLSTLPRLQDVRWGLEWGYVESAFVELVISGGGYSGEWFAAQIRKFPSELQEKHLARADKVFHGIPSYLWAKEKESDEPFTVGAGPFLQALFEGSKL